MSDAVVAWCQEQLTLTQRGKNPHLLAELASGWAVMGDTQFLPGYCLLLSRYPVPALNELPVDQQRAFLADMARLGRAV